MNRLFLFFIIYFAASKKVDDVTVEVYFDTLGTAYLNYESVYVNQVINQQDFNLSAGYIKATFEIKNHDIYLERYHSQPQKNEREIQGSFSPMFDKTLYIAIIRGANRTDPTKCTPIEKAREYVKYVELSMRLWSGNQVRISQGNDLYISSKCLTIEDSIYSKSLKDIMNALTDAAKASGDTIPKVGVRWYITDDFTGGWLGMAAGGSASVVSNRNSNYWLICKYNPSVEDPTNKKLTTLTHEYGHSCGFGHGGTNGYDGTGTFTTFKEVDNYNDCANIMGNCAPWDRPITANQYYQVVVRKKPEPWLFKNLEEGIHKYRIYAIDHPYTRHFLGTNESFHNDTEMFDGIAFKYNCLAIRILVNKSLTSKYAGADGTSGSIMFEYRHNPNGQKGAQDFGIRITYGYGSKGNLLMANIDNLKSWADSEIMMGIDYYPADFDSGTLRVRITKIHKSPLKESLEKEIVKENKRNYDECSYAEVEIEFYSNRRPPSKQSPAKDLPNFIFSPSFYNCIKNNDEGYNCSKSSTNSGWYYFVNDGNRNKNNPRFYSKNDIFSRGRLSIRSYNGWDFSNSKVCYGDNEFRCITVNIESMNYNVRRSNFHNSKVTRYRLDDVNKTIEDLGVNNVIFGTKLKVSEGERAYITDLYGNEKDIKVINEVFAVLIPPLVTDGFSEGAVVVKDKDGKVSYYNAFTLYNPQNDNRIAIEFKENDEIELSPAVIPNNKYYTTTGFIYSVRLKADKWFVYPILNLKDNDYILFDFKGEVANDLTIRIESDMGEYFRDLSELGGLSNISYKLSFLELNRATGGWGEIGRIKFNKEVELQNIRPIYRNKVGDQIREVNDRESNFNFDGYRYKVEASRLEGTYTYNKVNVEMNGEIISFDTPISKKIIKAKKKEEEEEKGIEGWVIAVIIVSSVIVVALISGIIVYIISKRRRKVAATAPMP